MDQPTWQSLLPPIIAIATALITKQVFLSLFSGIWLGWILLDGGNPILGLRDALESMVAVFLDRGNALILIFSAQIGAFIALTQRSGGVEGFVNWIVDRGYVRTAKGARLLPSVIGLGLFLESNLTCLISGAVARPLFDRFSLSREKLAYLCDSTAAPVCVLFPFNAYGAVIMGILASQNVANPIGLLVSSMVFNFYALISVAFVFYIAISGRDWGPMARAETRARVNGQGAARRSDTARFGRSAEPSHQGRSDTPCAQHGRPDARAARDGALRPPPDGRRRLDGHLLGDVSRGCSGRWDVRWAADLHRARIYHHEHGDVRRQRKSEKAQSQEHRTDLHQLDLTEACHESA